jgi:hypothetical protein
VPSASPSFRLLEEQCLECSGAVVGFCGGDRQFGFEFAFCERVDAVLSINERPAGACVVVTSVS